MKTTMKKENETILPVGSDDLLSLGERRRLLALGKKLEELETRRTAIMTKARGIIGFETAEAVIGINEELEETWMQYPQPTPKMVLVAYGEATRKRWKLEEAVESMKALMLELGVKPEDIDWDNR